MSRGCARRCAASRGVSRDAHLRRSDQQQRCRAERGAEQHQVGLAQRDHLGRRVERDAQARSRPRARTPTHSGSGRASATSSAADRQRQRQHRLVRPSVGTMPSVDRAEARDQRGDEGDQRAPRPQRPAGRSADRAPSDRHQMRRHEQRMQQAAEEAGDAERRRMRRAPARPISSERHGDQRRASAFMRAGRGTSARRCAIAPPAARTAIRPAGQRASRPKAMPARCRQPVAMTKPAE